MKDIISHVKNPLSVIAIFASIVEVSAATALPFLYEENQTLFTWFLMCFPTLLILLFFGTLNFNNKVLYAPSDYKDENNFHVAGQQVKLASEEEVLEKKVLDRELEEDKNKPNISDMSNFLKKAELEDHNIDEEIKSFIISDESQKYKNSSIFRNAKLSDEYFYVFDGIITNYDVMVAIEIRDFSDLEKMAKQNTMLMDKMLHDLKRFKKNRYLRLTQVFLHDKKNLNEQEENVRTMLNEKIDATGVAYEVVIYHKKEILERFSKRRALEFSEG